MEHIPHTRKKIHVRTSDFNDDWNTSKHGSPSKTFPEIFRYFHTSHITLIMLCFIRAALLKSFHSLKIASFYTLSLLKRYFPCLFFLLRLPVTFSSIFNLLITPPLRCTSRFPFLLPSQLSLHSFPWNLCFPFFLSSLSLHTTFCPFFLSSLCTHIFLVEKIIDSSTV